MIELQITSITAPTFNVNGRVDINEYTLRNMLIDVAKGKIKTEEITVTCNQSRVILDIRQDGMIDNEIVSLNLLSDFTFQLLREQKLTDDDNIRKSFNEAMLDDMDYGQPY